MRFKIFTVSIAVAATMLVAAAARATDVQSLAQRAVQAANAGQTANALGFYELALTESVNQPGAVFGPIEGQYWQLIAKTDNFPRAMSFFSALAAEQQKPNSTVLSNKANAIGGYIGWLYKNNLAESLPAGTLKQMDAGARRDYARALKLSPDSFNALYGYAVYESYNPNGRAHMQQLLTRLNSLRSSHPHYPWQLVDYLQTHGHPRM